MANNGLLQRLFEGETQKDQDITESVAEEPVDDTPKAEIKPPEQIENIEPKNQKVKDLQDLEEQIEKLTKSLQKLSTPKNIRGELLQLGVNIRVDSQGKLQITSQPSSLHGKRVGMRVQSYIVSLNMLQQRVRDAQIKLSINEPISTEELNQIKALQQRANTEWGTNEEEQQEFKSIVLLGRALSKSADREKTPDLNEKNKDLETINKEAFASKLDEKVNKLNSDPEEIKKYKEDIKKEQEIIEKMTKRFGKLLLNRADDPEYVKKFLSRPEFAHLKWGLATEAIDIEDITDDDIKDIIEYAHSNEDNLTQDKEELISETEKNEITSELLGDSERSENLKNQLKDIAEITTSHDSSAVRARTKLATDILDEIVSRSNPNNPFNEDAIDQVFKELGLDSSDVPSDRIRNYEDASIIREAYKTIIRERNEKVLNQQNIRFEAVKDKLKSEDREIIEKIPQNDTTTKSRRIEDIISSNPEIISSADEALIIHFTEEIKEKTKNTSVIDPKKIQIEHQSNGYYVLIVQDRETFNRLTGSTSKNTYGAAYKHNNVYIRLIHDEVTKEKGSKQSKMILPENDLVSQHEITHLKFDEERKIKIAREQYFTATKMLNIITKERSDLQIDTDELLNRILELIQLPVDERNSKISKIKTDDPLSILVNAISAETVNNLANSESDKSRLSSTKLARLLKSHNERITAIDYRNEQNNKSFQVEELAAELFGEFADESTDDKGEKKSVPLLDISAIGLGDKDNLETINSDKETNSDFFVHNIEAGNMLRILNLASLQIPDGEQRLEYVKKWSKRIMQFEEFNQTNTMLFIFELQNSDKIQINPSTYNQNVSRNQQENLLTGREGDYIRLAERYKDGAFTYLVKEMINKGNFSQVKNNDELSTAIQNAYETYEEIINLGLNFKDLKTDKQRDVDNENFKFASRPMYDGLIRMLNDMNVIGYPYSKAWPPGFNFVMEGLGLKVKDVTEKGLIIRRGKDRTGKTRWLFGRDATTMPVKYSANLPFGLGEIRDRFLGIKDESFVSSEYVKRLGVEHLDMDIAEMFNLQQRSIADRLQKSNYYISTEQVYFILDRIGLIHFHDGKPDQTYNSLAYEHDQYLSKYLYTKTDANGNIVPGGTRSIQGDIIYNRLFKNGFRGRDLHLLMEAHNPIQRMQRRDGTIYDVDAESKRMKIGVINMRLAERMKMMRFNYNTKDENAARHIAEGKRFDSISQFIMEVNEHSFDDTNPTDPFTMTDVIKAIIDVDNIRPNDNDPNTTTLEKWNKAKATVTLNHNGQSIEVDRDTLKQYVRCFFYAKTYEAMATGIYGEESVFQINDVDPVDNTKTVQAFYEIKSSNRGYTKHEEEAIIQDLVSINLTDAELQYENEKKSIPSMPDWATLTNAEKLKYLHNTRYRHALKNYGVSITIRGAGSLLFTPSIPAPVASGATTSYQMHNYKKVDKSIYFRVQGGISMTEVNAHQGVKKSDMNTEFMDFKHHDGGTDPNAYSVGTIEGKLINAVEDVIGEKQTINYLYFYFRQLMVQADNYRKDASKQKEKWVGIARFNMLLRWAQTGLTLMALAGIGPAALGLFLNPWMIIALLGNYFVIANRLTRTGDLHGKRKVAAIKAVNELKQLEPNFEKALFNPDFSLGPERDRLFQLCKVAEDILKGALVTSVDTPSNVLAEVSKSLGETAKSYATGD